MRVARVRRVFAACTCRELTAAVPACSNNKALLSLDWHPTNRSWIAASVVSDLSFEARVTNSGRASVSHVVIYTFSEFSAQVRAALLSSRHVASRRLPCDVQPSLRSV